MPFEHYLSQSAAITQGAAGQTQIVAAQANHKIQVLGYVVVMDAAGTFKFQSANTDKTGAMPAAANGGVSSSEAPFSTEKNEALNITTTVGKAFGHVAYRLIPA